ncbi:c-type cytochrome [Thermus oshimai]
MDNRWQVEDWEAMKAKAKLSLALALFLGSLVLMQEVQVGVQTSEHPALGAYLTDGQGRSLYLYTQDSQNTPTCYDQCAQTWPPLLVKEKAVAGKGVAPNLLGVAKRRDGSLQVTYNGWPLYYFVRDQKPGDVLGQGVGGVWFLVSPKGEALKPSTDQQPAGAQTDALLAQLKAEGETLFTRVCASCHGAQGQGGVGPTLQNNTRLQDVSFLVEAVTKGLGYMPPVAANLTNREVAAVLTFVRTSFGNSYGLVDEEEVARLR